MTNSPLPVVGIGADGWTGLTTAAQAALRQAEVILGGRRHLDLLPEDITAERAPWPSPMLPALPGLLDAHAGRRIAVLASGDPMFYGVGATLARLLGPTAVRVLPHPSAAALACARLGWPAEDVEVVSVVGRPLAGLLLSLAPGRRLLVLSADAGSPAAIAGLLRESGYGASGITVAEQLGGPGERRTAGSALNPPAGPFDPLNLVAVECVADGGVTPLPRVPGLPDDTYATTDGQLTKREIRAITLARLGPLPGQLLWDVGAGSGSVGIEWMRAHPSCRAIAVESQASRAAHIAGNAEALGVPGLTVVVGAAPAALVDLPSPDAVFVGGGVTADGVLDACWAALRPGGRLVANAVTVESETVVAGWRARLGGELTRISISRATPVGGFTGWRPAMPITQWVVTK
ncbi:precorrin-6y C5,15-methyltransferase (decarboxylating) subunit CbiE [Pilimelia columellifera]|uniref:Precorrin-6y C5,15-methyltransferase (Decarboxylating) subunit CbiE n=1 Tax=Pilimelia columellifera subsp. columellifera TaxID=706583 RepID=A0ABN3N605_9ACTN